MLLVVAKCRYENRTPSPTASCASSTSYRPTKVSQPLAGRTLKYEVRDSVLSEIGSSDNRLGFSWKFSDLYRRFVDIRFGAGCSPSRFTDSTVFAKCHHCDQIVRSMSVCYVPASITSAQVGLPLFFFTVSISCGRQSVVGNTSIRRKTVKTILITKL